MNMRSGELIRQPFMVGLSHSFQSSKALFSMKWSHLKKLMFYTMKEREKISAFLAKGTQFEGRLTFYKAIRIDGHFCR